MIVRAAVVEDDKSFAESLTGQLSEYSRLTGQEIAVSGFATAESLLAEGTDAFDILLLDIELPGMDGMALAETIRNNGSNAEIIFITNSPQYAIAGYKVGAMDYVLKPVSETALFHTLDTAIERCRAKETRFLSVPVRGGYRKVAVSSIRYLEVRDHDLTIHTTEGDITTRAAIRDMQQELPAERFFHCNKGYLINLAYVDGITGQDIQIGADIIPVGRTKKKAFLEAMNRYLNR